VTGQPCHTCHSILKLLGIVRFTSEERRAAVAQAQRSIRETTAILAQRERDRLMRMPVADTIH
jgi:hypothetical protein